MDYEELDGDVYIRRSEYRKLLNLAADAQRQHKENEILRKEIEILRSGFASLSASAHDLKADNDTLNAKIRVLKELIKEIVVNG